MTEMNQKEHKWKVDYIKLWLGILKDFIFFIVVPTLLYQVLTEFGMVIDGDTYFGVFGTLFIIQCIKRGSYAPRYRLATEDEIQKH